MNVLTNIIGFNISWFGLVYFGNSFIPIALALLIIHLVFLVKHSNELMFIMMVAIIGIVVDSLLHYSNIFVFANHNGIPLWLIMLWGCFGATLCHSLRFLSVSKWLQVAAGLVAPLSYIAGNKMGAVDFGQPILTTYIILGCIWPVLFMLFYYVKANFVDKDNNHV